MNVVFLWHMHQPYYVNPLTKRAMMPWVRLHAVKGYLDMIDLVSRFPEIKVNFNFTPVLVKQIEELANAEVEDVWETWSRCPAGELNDQMRHGILENFFKINWETLIKPRARYWELLQRRGLQWDHNRIQDVISLFTAQDFLDLQVWYNLAWCGYSAERRYPLLAELKRKGSQFTEEEKHALLDTHREILKNLLPLYREAVARGQVEITTTPYFHPIQPLVYDTNLARRCMPHATLPPQFSAPDDVRAHLRLAQEQHERVFGTRARGLWPSEGSVAPELVPLWKEAGLDYFCTDEGNLFRSLEQDAHWRGRQVDHLELFQGWRVRHQNSVISALFRERPLSDFIGFSASQNDYAHSAHHLLHHLDHLATVVTRPQGCVLLALDGENAWEAFHDGGEQFLSLVYEGLRERRQMPTLRLGDYFDAHVPVVEISHLHTGSWINSDFDIWIGDAEENKGWDLIRTTRAFLVEQLGKAVYAPEVVESAWWSIYAAEGSDWFWWYGPDFTTDCDLLFDELFRTHLKNVYTILGCEPPAVLEIPICAPSQPLAYSKPHQYITPVLTGRLGSYYDWVGAGVLNLKQQQTAMFQSDRVGELLYYGFDPEFFYLRLDLRRKPEQVQCQFVQPSSLKLVAEQGAGKEWRVTTGGAESKAGLTAAWEEFLVLRVPRTLLAWHEGKTVEFYVSLYEKGLMSERFPERGTIEFPAPTAAFESSQWFV